MLKWNNKYHSVVLQIMVKEILPLLIGRIFPSSILHNLSALSQFVWRRTCFHALHVMTLKYSLKKSSSYFRIPVGTTRARTTPLAKRVSQTKDIGVYACQGSRLTIVMMVSLIFLYSLQIVLLLCRHSNYKQLPF